MHALHKYIYIVNYFAKGDMESRMMRVLVCVGIFIKFTISIVHICIHSVLFNTWFHLVVDPNRFPHRPVDCLYSMKAWQFHLVRYLCLWLECCAHLSIHLCWLSYQWQWLVFWSALPGLC